MAGRLGIALAAAAVVVAPWLGGNPYTLKLLTLLAIYILLATGMNIIWGLAGQISLGQNGLYAVGAYASGVLTAKLSVSALMAIPIATALGGVAACVIALPALRVRGFYLAMVSLGFGMLVQTLANEWSSVTGGVQGLEEIPSPTLHTLDFAGLPVSFTNYYYVAFALAGLGLLVARNLIGSYWGRAMSAVRESEIAAAAQGVFVGKIKVAAFVIGGMYTALAGALYAHIMAYVSPEAFGIDMAVLIMIMPLVGGLGTLWGPVAGAMIFLALPELLQGLWQYNLLIYGVVLVASFTLFPQGVVGGLTRWVRAKPTASRNAALGVAPTSEPVMPAMPPKAAALVASGIEMHFGGLAALDGVDLTLQPGRVHAVIGPNGSGKSTLINVLTRIYAQSEGTIKFNGAAIDRLRPDQAAQAGIARTFQNLRLFVDLSASDNVLIGAHPRFRSSLLACIARTRSARREEAREQQAVSTLLAQFNLSAEAPLRAGSLSYGSQKLIELARAIAKNPALLMLDEPAAGLSAVEIDMLRQSVRALADAGAAVLLIEHNMDFVMGVADEITVLDQGRKISEGSPRAVQDDRRVIEAYLGVARSEQRA